MIKHCIIKSKGDTIVCLLSKVERPKTIEGCCGRCDGANDTCITDMDVIEAKAQCEHVSSLNDYHLAEWSRSFKEYPIRDEDKKEWIKFIIRQWQDGKIKYPHRYTLYKYLSEGISIDPSLVEIVKPDGTTMFEPFAVLVEEKICFTCGSDKNIETNSMGINTCPIH